MKIIKKLNNNVALGIDGNGRELIVFGKGVGFPEIPYDLNDLSKIDRTYYDIDTRYLDLVGEVPEEIFILSSKIVDYGLVKIDRELNRNIVFTLADHIHFAIQRYQKNMNFKVPIRHDIQYLYENEMNVGYRGVEWINDKMDIHLPKDEAVGIAMHFINAESALESSANENNDELIIQEITSIIEDHFTIKINQEGFNYSRFVSHMHYLLRRKSVDQTISSENKKMYESMKDECKEAYICSCKIKEYLQTTLNWNTNQEEILYLMLHINRLCTREDCNQ